MLLQELSEHMGLRQLNVKLAEGEMQPFVGGLFPRDSMADMRFSINYFTAIGLGGLTDTMRTDLKAAQVRLCTLCHCHLHVVLVCAVMMCFDWMRTAGLLSHGIQSPALENVLSSSGRVPSFSTLVLSGRCYQKRSIFLGGLSGNHVWS